jgi:hypothetical protein
VSDSDSKDIVRRWNREIEADIRRHEAVAHRDREGPWKVVAWVALWIAWLALLAVILMHVKALH